jgi:putative FmdB family regulatory protein
MPLYEYQCQECGRRTEKIQKYSDPELTVCPFCSGRLERTLTAPAVQFKGGGWYKDLYSSAKPANGSPGSGEKASSGTDAGSSKTADSSGSSGSGESGGSGGAASGSGAAASAPTTGSTATSTPAKT